MTERRLDHLDPATIAALVDRTLDPAARAAAEAHLAACADCREVWVETSEMAEAMGGGVAASDSAAAPNVVPHRPRMRRWIYAGAGLAAAAAIAVAVFMPTLFHRGDRPELRDLVEAVGENRRTEGRLAGGFAWSDPPAVHRGMPTLQPAVLIAANEAEARLRGERTIATLWTAGVARLITGRIDDAIRALEESASMQPTDARIWSDTAAAHIEKARLHSDRDAAVNALTTADRALALNPDLPEAQFNRALALELLGRRSEALDAWNRSAEQNTDAGWQREARARAQALASQR